MQCLYRPLALPVPKLDQFIVVIVSASVPCVAGGGGGAWVRGVSLVRLLRTELMHHLLKAFWKPSVTSSTMACRRHFQTHHGGYYVHALFALWSAGYMVVG